MPSFVRLYPRHFDESQIVCLGKQLSEIVSSIPNTDSTLQWYTADVTPSANPVFSSRNTAQHLGDSNRLIQESNSFSQFESGVFMAVPSSLLSPDFRDPIYTEDEVEINIGDSKVELRVFDTSFFEILSDDDSILQGINARFNNGAIG